MSTFIRIIGRASWNGYGFDLYENKDGSATIRPTRNGNDLPTRFWKKFESIKAAENKIEFIAGEDVYGIDRVIKLINEWL